MKLSGVIVPAAVPVTGGGEPNLEAYARLLDFLIERVHGIFALQLGFDAITEGLHHVVPALTVRLYETQRAGNFQEGDRIQEKINRCFGIFDANGGGRGLKVALDHLGIARHSAPLPYNLPLFVETRDLILQILETEQVTMPRASCTKKVLQEIDR